MYPGVRGCAYFHIGTSEVVVTASAGLYCRGGDAILRYCTWELGGGWGTVLVASRCVQRSVVPPSLPAIPAVSVLVRSGSPLGSKRLCTTPGSRSIFVLPQPSQG